MTTQTTVTAEVDPHDGAAAVAPWAVGRRRPPADRRLRLQTQLYSGRPAP